jgi:RimJ/RimL family protein N-acetyltransferase
MNDPTLAAREITEQDIDALVNYWFNATPDYLRSMGADPAKLPEREQWRNMLTEQIDLPYEQKQSYCTIWTVDGKAVGHSNVNKIVFGEEASMHLHLWNADTRAKGFGANLVKRSLPWFFEKLKLKNVYSEPYALNPAPNKTLPKAGFEFVKEYTTTPGSINFEQPVKLWNMSEERFRGMR